MAEIMGSSDGGSISLVVEQSCTDGFVFRCASKNFWLTPNGDIYFGLGERNFSQDLKNLDLFCCCGIFLEIGLYQSTWLLF
jgi:hypothetical protein